MLSLVTLGFTGLFWACDGDVRPPLAAGGAPQGGSPQASDASGTPDGSVGRPDGAIKPVGMDSGSTGIALRSISVSDERPRENFIFTPEDADSTAVGWWPHPQVGRFKRALDGQPLPVRSRLVVTLNGLGNPAGPTEVALWLTDRGFHTLTLDYRNTESVRLLPDSVMDDGLPGGIEAYSEIIEGVDHSPNIDVPRPDSVLGRLDSALQYLSINDPGADWAYYLNADGGARLEAVMFFGYSFGAATSTVIGKRHRVARVVATAGPRYVPGVTDTWAAGPSATPLDRFYGIVGVLDPSYSDIVASMDSLGWPGAIVNTEVVPAPYNGSHRLRNDRGHTIMCLGSDLDAVCEYVFGIAR